MKTLIFCAIFLIVTQVSALPSAFDLRVQPDIVKYADYSLEYEGTCVAHAWGLQLAKIVSNAISLEVQSKIILSSQHIIECVSSVTDICHHSTL